MNHMKEVATLLGVELNEKFCITWENGLTTEANWTIREDGLYVQECKVTKDPVLQKLLTGEYKIKRLPFKPECGEGYWSYLYFDSCDTEPRLVNFEWIDSASDYINYYLGLCFRTEEEAEANKYKLQKIINHYKEA